MSQHNQNFTAFCIQSVGISYDGFSISEGPFSTLINGQTEMQSISSFVITRSNNPSDITKALKKEIAAKNPEISEDSILIFGEPK